MSDGHRSSSPYCHQHCASESCPGRPGPRPYLRTRTGPAPKAGPVLVFHCACTQLNTAPVLGVVCEGRLVGRPEHAPAQARPLRRASCLRELLCGATDINTGDAGSVRWIAFLGRACRRHRQLLSTMGNGGHSPLANLPFSISRARRVREPPLNWPFANVLVIARYGKHNLHPTGADTPVEPETPGVRRLPRCSRRHRRRR